MLIIIWPLLIALVGLFLYFAGPSQKWQNVGLVLFAVGAYWTVGMLTGQQFSVGGVHR